jgi:hypothetical protein
MTPFMNRYEMPGRYNWPAFVILAKPDEYVVEFKAYQVTGVDGNGGAPLFGDMSNATTNLSEAPVFIHGSVKWDGCSNWHFDEQDKAMLHFCGPEDAAEVGQLLARMYEIARELLGKHWRT